MSVERGTPHTESGSPHVATDSGESSRFMTVPNGFTLLRLLCLPVFLYLLFGLENRAAAAWLLGGLGATDWVDGYLARRLGQVSEFGKKFDPTVDRLLMIVAITAILVDGAGPRLLVGAVLVRELLVGGAVAIATLLYRMERFDVTYVGKLATFVLMFALPAFMLGASDFPGHQGFEVIGWVLGAPGVVLSYVAGLQYVPLIRNGVRAARS